MCFRVIWGDPLRGDEWAREKVELFGVWGQALSAKGFWKHRKEP